MSESETTRGQFMIAAKHLRDPNFFKTVVLMVEHNSGGAMGLVINRPSTVTVSQALSEHFTLPATDDFVYVGGPVEPSALFILHDAAELDSPEPAVVPGLYVGSSATAFESIVRSAAEEGGDCHFRIFAGCAGWGPGQLETEISRGDWHLISATVEDALEGDPYELWDETLTRFHREHRLFPNSGNPEWN